MFKNIYFNFQKLSAGGDPPLLPLIIHFTTLTEKMLYLLSKLIVFRSKTSPLTAKGIHGGQIDTEDVHILPSAFSMGIVSYLLNKAFLIDIFFSGFAIEKSVFDILECEFSLSESFIFFNADNRALKSSSLFSGEIIKTTAEISAYSQ